MSISLPLKSNTLPVVLAHSPEELNISALLQESTGMDASSKQVCTSINNFRVLTQSNSDPNMNYTSCTWVFSLWIPLGYLQHECEANITFTDSVIIMGLHILYFSVGQDQQIEVTTEQSTESQLHYTHSSLFFLPPPLHYHSEVNNRVSENSYIYPIAVDKFSNTIYFYSSSSTESTVFIPSISSELSNSNLTLLYNDKAQGRLAWKISSSNLLNTTITLYEDHECEIPDCTPTLPHKFTMRFRQHSQDEALIPMIEIIPSVRPKGLSSMFRVGEYLHKTNYMFVMLGLMVFQLTVLLFV